MDEEALWRAGSRFDLVLLAEEHRVELEALLSGISPETVDKAQPRAARREGPFAPPAAAHICKPTRGSAAQEAASIIAGGRVSGAMKKVRGGRKSKKALQSEEAALRKQASSVHVQIPSTPPRAVSSTGSGTPVTPGPPCTASAAIAGVPAAIVPPSTAASTSAENPPNQSRAALATGAEAPEASMPLFGARAAASTAHACRPSDLQATGAVPQVSMNASSLQAKAPPVAIIPLTDATLNAPVEAVAALPHATASVPVEPVAARPRAASNAPVEAVAALPHATASVPVEPVAARPRAASHMHIEPASLGVFGGLFGGGGGTRPRPSRRTHHPPPPACQWSRAAPLPPLQHGT